MRALRNLNPRYQADSYLAAGTSLNATTKIVGLYNRWCVQGARADLARTLMLSDPNNAIVRTGPVTMVESPDSSDGTAPVAAEPVPAEKPDRPKAKSAPSTYRVQRGETLTSIAQKFQCDTGQLARRNGLKAPRYAIRPGQTLKLDGCK
jgi:membrane-bound lytic murein transglycosylase D